MLRIYTHRKGLKGKELNGLVQLSRTSGLKSGLDALGVQYQYQPDDMPQDGDQVLIMSDHRLIREMIKYKKTQNVDFTLACGPIFEIDDAHRSGKEAFLIEAQKLIEAGQLDVKESYRILDPIISDSEVDAVLTAGYWAKNAWRYLCPSIGNKIYEWRAGVDLSFWDGERTPKKKRVVLYDKMLPKLADNAQNKLEKMGFDVDRITYGSYSLKELREALRQCEFAVVISAKETQGIALAEMWAMNVPTLCREIFATEFDGLKVPTSACPYLTKDTGRRWQTVADLEEVITAMSLASFSPRSWVGQNMSNTISAEILLELFAYIEFKKDRNISLPT